MEQLRELCCEVCNTTDGQVSVTWTESNLLRFRVKISPKRGLYLGRSYNFTIRASNGYPTTPPIIISQSYILHPNINEYGEVSHPLLTCWQENYDLAFVCHVLLQLLQFPNFSMISISNEEISHMTEPEFLSAVEAWKTRKYREPTPIFSCEQSRNVLKKCTCNDSYIIVTNSRKPKTYGRRRNIRFVTAKQPTNNMWGVPRVEYLDLSDIYEEIQSITADYEITSIASDAGVSSSDA